MTGTKRIPAAGSRMERTLARRWSPWQEAPGLLALAVAVALWGVVVIGVVAPLGDALARLEARAAAAPDCPVPPDAVAAALAAPPAATCP